MNAGLCGSVATRAVFLELRDSSPWIADSERELLWRLFEVPVLGVLVNQRQEVLAYECEAQYGMHLNFPLESLGAARLESNVCMCGRSGSGWSPPPGTFSAADRELPVAV